MLEEPSDLASFREQLQNGELLDWRDCILKIAQRYAGNEHDAEDIAQDFLVKQLACEKNVAIPKFRPWLQVGVRNMVIDHLRRKKRRPTVHKTIETFCDPRHSFVCPISWEDMLIRHCGGLDAQQMTLLRSEIFASGNYKVIAEMMGWGTTRVYEERKHLEEYFRSLPITKNIWVRHRGLQIDFGEVTGYECVILANDVATVLIHYKPDGSMLRMGISVWSVDSAGSAACNYDGITWGKPYSSVQELEYDDGFVVPKAHKDMELLQVMDDAEILTTRWAHESPAG